jgi:spore coat protein CotH
MDQKKGWYIKFNEFVSGQKLFDAKKIGLKPGSEADDNLSKSMLFRDLLRAVGGPVQRMSYALLYVNSVFVGLYVMHEDIDSDFIARRIQGEGKGDGFDMKLFWNVHLGYFGSNLSYYQNKVTVNALGKELKFITIY